MYRKSIVVQGTYVHKFKLVNVRLDFRVESILGKFKKREIYDMNSYSSSVVGSRHAFYND